MFVQKIIQALLVAAAVAAPVTVAQTAEPLIGEVSVNTISVHPIADSIIAEAYTIWGSSGWRLISNTSDVINEAKPVSGVFASSGVELTRAKAVVNVPAQKLFDFLITPEGYKLIDPASNPEDFSKPPLASYPVPFWRGIGNTDKKSLEVARTEAVVPGLAPREFVVLNAIDQLTRIFVSKSVQNGGDRGCSQYGPASCYNASAVPVRALNTFAVEVQPLAGNNKKSLVRLINYADVTQLPAFVMNQANSVFLVDMVGRMRAAFP